jgi:hypothetical protein
MTHCRWLLVCIYRSPHSDVHIFSDKLETFVKRVRKKRKKLIICGDWNRGLKEEYVTAGCAAGQGLHVTKNWVMAVIGDPKIPASGFDVIFATTLGRDDILPSGILVLR